MDTIKGHWMNRTRAIAKKCLECSGDSAKEVTLCHIFDCPLWQFRFGSMNLGSPKFNKRMNRIKTDYPEEYRFMQEIAPEYVQNIPDKRVKTYIEGFLGKTKRNP